MTIYNQVYNENSTKNVVSTISEKQLNCQTCNKFFSSKGYLNRHIQSIHVGVQYKCGQCNYKANQKGTLQSHIKSIHVGNVITRQQTRVISAGIRSNIIINYILIVFYFSTKIFSTFRPS